jgi:GTP:adenosylcobinamide-phosphate guanylyltransferase
MRVDAVVLAGAKNDGKLQQADPAEFEALIDINGKVMLDYVLAALRGCEEIGRVVVVGPDCLAERVTAPNIEYIRCGETMFDNLRLGIASLQSDTKVLIVTSDIPLIEPEAIQDFIRRCNTVEADVYYPITSKEVNEQKYPGVHRTYVTLQEGVFTGGNLVLLSPDFVEHRQHLIIKAIMMRKKPWQLARLLGFKSFVHMMTNKLSIREIEARVEQNMGFKGIGIISPYPEVGIDVDKPSDLELAIAALPGKTET